MVRFSDYAGNYLKGGDLDGREWLVTIDKIVVEHVGDREKLVAHFVGRQKKLPLNLGHVAFFRQSFGEDPANCGDRQVILYPEATRTPSGEPAIGVRIKLPHGLPAQQAAPQQAATIADAMDDEIPF